MLSKWFRKVFTYPIIERPPKFDASTLSWQQLRDQLNDLNRMELHYAASNVTEILKRIMDRLSEKEDVQ